ncbi:MAG: 16S rRNA (guanine(966)-N(2))-methyltransferase RsmD [Chloroflexi bacterium]|nr:16S rRNA (guanine(966)-N(2))-methyltransferase RsmD [Chloroflexota bacterium]
MRVIAGVAKGLHLKVPSKSPIRPTTDLVRGAIFSILESVTGDWSRVLDMYAGTGALGIEALSRGAQWADFVEQDARCCAIIKENLEITGLADGSHVYCVNARRALTFLHDSYNIVFADPPYALPGLDKFVLEIGGADVLGVGSILVLPHSSRVFLGESYGQLRQLKERRHGDTLISIYRKEAKQ